MDITEQDIKNVIAGAFLKVPNTTTWGNAQKAIADIIRSDPSVRIKIVDKPSDADLEAKIIEWRSEATALDHVAEILSIEDQHHESRANDEIIRRLRSMAVVYRECAASAESLTIPF